MGNKKYVAPKTGAVLEFAKIIVSVNGILGAKVKEIMGDGHADTNVLFGNVVTDEESYTNEEAAVHFIEWIEDAVNDENNFVESLWDKMTFFHCDPFGDDWEKCEGDEYTMTFKQVMEKGETDNEKFYQFVILVDAVAYCAMYEYYNTLLPKAFGIDVIPQPLRFYPSAIPDYVYLNDTSIEDCSITTTIPYHRGCIEAVSDVIVNTAAVSIIGLLKDEPKYHLLGSSIVNNLFNTSIAMARGDAVFLMDKNGIRCNPAYITKLRNVIIQQTNEGNAFASAWILTLPSVVKTDSILTDLAMYNFIGLITASDAYMGKYALVNDDDVVYKRSLLNGVAGLFQYAHVALSQVSSEDRKMELTTFKSTLRRATLLYNKGGITDYIWSDLVATLLNKRDIINKSPENMVLYKPEKKDLTPILSMYTIIAPHINGGLHRDYAPRTAIMYTHQEFHQMLDLMIFLIKFNDNQLCWPFDSDKYFGLILLYDILILAYGHIKLNKHDIMDLYEFLHACRSNGMGRMLLCRIGNLVDPTSDLTKDVGIDSILGGCSPKSEPYPDWKFIPEAGFLFDVTSRPFYYIRALVWLSKTTVYKATQLVNYLESIQRDHKDKVDIVGMIETKTIDDVMRDME